MDRKNMRNSRKEVSDNFNYPVKQNDITLDCDIEFKCSNMREVLMYPFFTPLCDLLMCDHFEKSICL